MLTGEELREGWSTTFAGMAAGGDALDAWLTAPSGILQYGWMEVWEKGQERAAQSSSQEARTRAEGGITGKRAAPPASWIEVDVDGPVRLERRHGNTTARRLTAVIMGTEVAAGPWPVSCTQMRVSKLSEVSGWTLHLLRKECRPVSSVGPEPQSSEYVIHDEAVGWRKKPMPTVSWPLGEDEHGDAMASGVLPPPRPPLHPMQGVTPARWGVVRSWLWGVGRFPSAKGLRCGLDVLVSASRTATQEEGARGPLNGETLTANPHLGTAQWRGQGRRAGKRLPHQRHGVECVESARKPRAPTMQLVPLPTVQVVRRWTRGFWSMQQPSKEFWVVDFN